jgi:transposase-like protein
MEDFYIPKKGQTFQKHSLEFKEQIIKEYQEGRSQNKLASTYNIPEGNVAT